MANIMKEQFKEGRILYDLDTQAKYDQMVRELAKRKAEDPEYANCVDPEDRRFMMYVEHVPKEDRFNHLARWQKRKWQKRAKDFLKALKEAS